MSLAALKNAQISANIAKEVEKGQDLRAALDAVLGAGTYEKLAGDLYDALRAKVAK